MVTYEQLQALSNELGELDQQCWNAALLQDNDLLERLKTLSAEKLAAYELAYAEYYDNVKGESEYHNPIV